MKNTFTKLICKPLVISLLVAAVPFNSTAVSQAATVQTLASFTFSKSDGPSTAKDLNDTYSTKADNGYSPTSGLVTSSRLFSSVTSPSDSDFRKLEWSSDTSYTYNGSSCAMPIMAASTKNPWGSTPYFLIKTSTKGYEKITISLLLGGSKKGPAEYSIQYSLDGKSYGNITGTNMTIKENKKMVNFSYTLSSTFNNQNTVYLRIITSSDKTIEGGSFTSASSSGETAINNVIVKGTKQSVATPAPTPGTTSSDKSSTSSSSTTNSSSQSSSSSTNAPVLSKPSLTTYKRGSKVIKGKSVAGSTVTVKVKGKTYTATATSKNKFKIKLKAKLKKGNIIKIKASKSGYTVSKARKYKVK